MHSMKQMLVISLAAMAVSLLSAPDLLAGGFKGPIGLQLYSLRADFAKDVPGTLQKVHSFGIKNVELAGTYNLAPEKFKELLAANKLKAVSGHFPFERYRDDLEGV